MPIAKSPAPIPSSRRASSISSAVRDRLNSSRRTQIDHFHLGRGNLTGANDEVRCALRHGERDVGPRLEQSIGDLLKPRRVCEIRVFVHDRRNSPHGACEPSERRRAVSVKVKDVDLFCIDHMEQGAQCPRIELRPLQVVISTPRASSVSSERSRFRRLTRGQPETVGIKRGMIHANRRFTPCIRDPFQPRWSQTWRTFNGRFIDWSGRKLQSLSHYKREA